MEVPTVVITCCNDECGMSFAVPSWWDKGKRETHKRFYCPNGHGQSYTAETDLEKVRRERDILKQQTARLQDERNEFASRAVKAEVEARKLKKRAIAGTCPCCQRTFSNMTRHMKNKHPTFSADVVTLKQANK